MYFARAVSIRIRLMEDNRRFSISAAKIVKKRRVCYTQQIPDDLDIIGPLHNTRRMKEAEFEGQYRFDAIWPSAGRGVYKVMLDGRYNFINPETGEYVAKMGWFDVLKADCNGYALVAARPEVDPIHAFERDHDGNPVLDKDGRYIPLYNHIDVSTGRMVFKDWLRMGKDFRRPTPEEVREHSLGKGDMIAYASEDGEKYRAIIAKADGTLLRKDVKGEMNITLDYSSSLKRAK